MKPCATPGHRRNSSPPGGQVLNTGAALNRVRKRRASALAMAAGSMAACFPGAAPAAPPPTSPPAVETPAPPTIEKAFISFRIGTSQWMPEPRRGPVALALLNASFDTATGLELAVATPSERLRVFDMEAKDKFLRASRTVGPYRHFQLPAIEPWTLRLIVVQKP